MTRHPDSSADASRGPDSEQRTNRGWRWWIHDSEGRLAVAQAPNAALGVWLVTVVLGWTGVLSDELADRVDLVGQGALIVWALDEVVRGASPFRRVLGVVVLAFQIVRLLG